MISNISITQSHFLQTKAPTEKKELGQFFTPSEIATFMASLITLDKDKSQSISVLDAGAGAGILGISALLKLKELGFKKDPDVLDTWFSSALWPFASQGWHDKNTNKPVATDANSQATPNAAGPGGASHPAGTFVAKNSAHWFEQTLGGRLPFEIRTWRSVSVSFLRTVIPSNAWGRFCLKVLYRLEEWFPHFFGRNGQYPLIVIRKPAAQQPSAQE